MFRCILFSCLLASASSLSWNNFVLKHHGRKSLLSEERCAHTVREKLTNACLTKRDNVNDGGSTGSSDEDLSRRSFFVRSISSLPGALVLATARVASGEWEGPENMTPFNGLIFNYRGNKFNGLEATDINGPSVPYKEFLERLSAGDVDFVEFLAPNGDEAFVTFKAKEGEEKPAPIRIGEGYPIEQNDGWSSPSFVVRAVKDKGVPYNFFVPGLSAYK